MTAKKPQGGRRDGFLRLPDDVFDCERFPALTASSVLTMLAVLRQHNGQNNGQLAAHFAQCRRYGINSEDTLRRSIAQLIEHGFLFRTRSAGPNKQWARYALTWLLIEDPTDLFVEGFERFAYRKPYAEWEKHSRKKHGTTLAKSMETSIFPPQKAWKSAKSTPAKSMTKKLAIRYRPAAGCRIVYRKEACHG